MTLSPLESRVGREEQGGRAKIESMENCAQHLRGGSWIASRTDVMTLAVCWEARGKTYGLSVARGFEDYGATSGQPVFAFDSNEPEVPVKHFKTGKITGFAHKNRKIGSIVSMDSATDSAVFEINPGVPVSPLEISLSSRDCGKLIKIEIPTPGVREKHLPYDSKLVMFGASCRGMVGYRAPHSESEGGPEDVSVSASIAVQSQNSDD